MIAETDLPNVTGIEFIRSPVRIGDQNNIPLVKQKHRTENTINANKCELSKVQILLACFMQNTHTILKAYSTQKVGSGGNFESGNQGYAADGKYKLTIEFSQHTRKKLTSILTRKCFTFAIKTIQLSSHIIKHDEFIKATFSSEQFFETNNIFAIRGKNPFYFITCVKRRNSIVSNMRNIRTN